MGGCRATRYLPEDQALVTRVQIDSIDKEFAEEAYLYIQKDIQPNSKLNLALYNTFNTKKGKYRTDKVKKIGEAPHVVDTSLIEISREQIERFLKIKGYFKAGVKSDVIVKNQKARIIFTAEEGPEFNLRNITFQIPDTAVAKIYTSQRYKFTRIRGGNRYDRDSLDHEREQIYRLLRSNGYYDYLRQYVRVDVDSNLSNSQVDLKIYIDNPENKAKHQIYIIRNSNITIRGTDGRIQGVTPDSTVIDSQYVFKDYSKQFKPSAISKYIYIKEGETYNIDKENLTYDRLYALNVFRNLKIEYKKTADSTNHLSPQFEIVPSKKMSNRIEGEFTFNSGRNGFNIGNTYSNRNLFGGAELLEINARIGILFDSRVKGNIVQKVFNRDLQVGANLVYPRLLVPFPIPLIGRNGIPHTTIASSYQLFDQRDAFSNRLLINSITYDWVETKYKLHTLTPLNIEYRRGRLDPAFRDSLEALGYQLYIRTNDRQFFNLGSQYSYTLNTLRLNTYDNFLFFRGSADVGGNTLGLLNTIFNFSKDEGFSTILGLPYLQYAKAEIDFRVYRSLGGERQFIARINPGFGVPYGNSEVLTFEKNFYAGGSSGVRAWQARTLGPGNYNRSVLPSETVRRNLRNLDQLGEIKIEANLEYRFKIVDNFFGSKLKGATFTDFGNIWRLRETDISPGGEFKFNKFLSQMAIGAGAGLRFDVEFFVFRFDAGLKIKDPQFMGADKWVIRNFFNKKEFKDRYERTNAPDVYRFVQYNFGIGMPF